MQMDDLVSEARRRGASDLHLEPGLPPTLRCRGSLQALHPEPISASVLLGLLRGLLDSGAWADLRRQGSTDLVRRLGGQRCRINVFQTQRGVGLALRLLPAVLPTLSSLNLHPDLRRLVGQQHGLILVSGPTGSGKSSTVAALMQEINLSQPCHLLTVEQPVEYALRPHRAFVRQREVGRDTPSFEQALVDALREDPDVILVGELREPSTMRLTLVAAETGHLVLSTLHSSTAAEALQRIVLAFPAEIQPSVAAQLADCLVAVVCQRLVWRPDLDLRVPECEILVPNSAVRAVIRAQEYFKLPQIMESGGAAGMWTRERYRAWIERRTEWARPPAGEAPGAGDDSEDDLRRQVRGAYPVGPPTEDAAPPGGFAGHRLAPSPPSAPPAPRGATPAAASPSADPGVLVIEDPSADAAAILRELDPSAPRRRR